MFPQPQSLLLRIIFTMTALSLLEASPQSSANVKLFLRRFFPPMKKGGNPCHSTFRWVWNKNEPPSDKDLKHLFDTNVPLQFNHDFVGITNPCRKQNDILLTSPTSSEDSPPENCRTIHLTKRVGKGETVYNSLRDAVLNWSPTLQNSTWAGVRPVGSARCLGEDITAPLPPLISRNVLQIWGEGGRRLVTFSRVFGSRLWCMNPCMVVYDLVDMQNDGSTFTSTAYATLKGHLLSGEERITVAMKKPSESKPLYTNTVSNVAHYSPKEEGDVYIEILSYSRPANPGFMGKIMFGAVTNMQRRFFCEQMDTLDQLAKEISGNKEER